MERPVFDRLIHVPGPNPLVRSGNPGEWDEHCIEACNVFKDDQTYYLYYHGIPVDRNRWGPGGYRLGVATAPHPLGPWTKYGDAPVVDVGPEGSWEAQHVACAAVLKERKDTYYLWYSGYSAERGCWSLGLCTGSSPVGPWTRHAANPVLEDFGYLGAVVKLEGLYWMYVEHPIGASSPDQGPFCLATAERPEGPWERYEGNPVLPAGDWGSWDDGGYSEAGVLYHEGIFHALYGGTKFQKLESIGYAYSLDGRRFHKHPANPVVLRERCPDTSGLAEVHALFEPPLLYAYHTLRYVSRPGEDIGVQILATSRPFRVTMPVLLIGALEPGRITDLDACPPVGTEHINTFAITVEGVCGDTGPAGVTVRVFPSHDGLAYDTEPAESLAFRLPAGGLSRRTVSLDIPTRFVKLTVDNEPPSATVTDLKVTATLGSL